MKRSEGRKLVILGIVLVVIDQVVKVLVKTNMGLGEHFDVIGNWFKILFVENNGMAFGIEWFSKLALTLFRLIVVGLLCWYTHEQIRQPKVPTGYIVTLAFIIAGALGNIIDCVFYGKLFGYAGWFYGRVVDMFYFPLIHNSAGEVLFFRPVFNFADSCITCAVFAILFFYLKELKR